MRNKNKMPIKRKNTHEVNNDQVYEVKNTIYMRLIIKNANKLRFLNNNV